MPAVAVFALVDAQFRALLAAQDIGPALRLMGIAIGILGFAVCAGAHRAFSAGRLAILRRQKVEPNYQHIPQLPARVA